MMWPTQCERVLRVDISQLLNFWCELKNLSDSMTKEGKNWEGGQLSTRTHCTTQLVALQLVALQLVALQLVV